MLGNQEETLALMREVLGNDYLDLHVDQYTMEENLPKAECRLRCELYDQMTRAKHVVEGVGVGLVDAFYNGIVATLGREFPSLKSIEFVDFEVKARLDTKKSKTGSDSSGEVRLTMRNSAGRHFTFAHTSRSITLSSIEATLNAAEYFVNSERAYITTYRALKHAQTSGRQDSVTRYTDRLVRLVENTSYTEVIDRIWKELK